MLLARQRQVFSKNLHLLKDALSQQLLINSIAASTTFFAAGSLAYPRPPMTSAQLATWFLMGIARPRQYELLHERCLQRN